MRPGTGFENPKTPESKPATVIVERPLDDFENLSTEELWRFENAKTIVLPGFSSEERPIDTTSEEEGIADILAVIGYDKRAQEKRVRIKALKLEELFDAIGKEGKYAGKLDLIAILDRRTSGVVKKIEDDPGTDIKDDVREIYREMDQVFEGMNYPDEMRVKRRFAFDAALARKRIPRGLALDVSDRLFITRPIAKGGAGFVYEAIHHILNRGEALKLVFPGREIPFMSEVFVRRFLRECRILGTINDPGILKVYTAGVDLDEGAWLAAEYIDGPDLRQAEAEKFDSVTNTRGFPVREIIDIAYQLSDILSKIHSKGVIHRDIKPANIIMGKDGKIKLIDFGISKDLRAFQTEEDGDSVYFEKEKATGILGTAEYMSPEQVSEHKLSVMTDIYSFGQTLYRLFTGGNAYAGATEISIMVKLSKNNHQKLVDRRFNDQRQEVPLRLALLVDWMMEINPDDRPTAEEIKVELEIIIKEDFEAKCKLKRRVDEYNRKQNAV